MNGVTRRQAITRAAAIAGSAIAIAAPNASADADPRNQKPSPAPAPQNPDRQFVLAAGFTEGEADCWEFAAKTAGAFFALPELHPMDKQEIASAIHIVQNKLLSRPTYRAYLENAKAAKPIH